tara:strand:+ start:138 stop:311 length:174 start_codon:yes stop_codon:yes gene_type:complete
MGGAKPPPVQPIKTFPKEAPTETGEALAKQAQENQDKKVTALGLKNAEDQTALGVIV